MFLWGVFNKAHTFRYYGIYEVALIENKAESIAHLEMDLILSHVHIVDLSQIIFVDSSLEPDPLPGP